MFLPLGYYAASGLINFATSFALGLLLLKNWKASPSRVFSLFSLTVAFWSIFYFLWLICGEKERAEFLLRTCMIGVLFMPSLFIHFVYAFLSPKRPKWLLFNYLFSLLCSLTVYTKLYAGEVGTFLVFPYWATPGPVFHISLLHFGGVVGYSFVLMGRALRKSTGLFRNQLKYVFVGTAIGYICGATNYFAWYRIPFPPVLNVFISLYVASVAYAIIRYRLLDIKLAALRTVVFTAVYVLVLGIPFLAALEWQPQFEQYLGSRWWIGLWFVCVFLTTVAYYANQYLQRRAERRLLANQLRSQTLLVAAASGMLRILHLPKLLKLIVILLMKYMKLTYTALYLKEEIEGFYELQVSRGKRSELLEAFKPDDSLVHYLGAIKTSLVSEELKRSVEEKRQPHLASVSAHLARMKVAVVVPSFFKERLLGFLLLGPRLSGEMFSNSDLATLDSLAKTAGVAIQNARLYQQAVNVETLEGVGEHYNVASHELANVFHIMTIRSGALKIKAKEKHLSQEEMEKALAEMEDNVLRGKTIINDGLAYRRQSETPGIQTFSLPDLIRETVETVKQRFALCPGIKLALDLPDNLPPIQGRPTLPSLPLSMLSHSYWALAGVAEPEGAVTLSVREIKSQEQVEIRLTDTGQSLKFLLEHPKEASGGGKLFPHRGKHGGLYFFLMQKVLSEHNGTFQVKDGARPGEGTTMIVRLPFKYTPPPLEQAEEDILGDAA